MLQRGCIGVSWLVSSLQRLGVVVGVATSHLNPAPSTALRPHRHLHHLSHGLALGGKVVGRGRVVGPVLEVGWGRHPVAEPHPCCLLAVVAHRLGDRQVGGRGRAHLGGGHGCKAAQLW